MTVHERRAARARWLETPGHKADLHARRASAELIRMFAAQLKRTRRDLRRAGVRTKGLSGADLFIAGQTGFLR